MRQSDGTLRALGAYGAAAVGSIGASVSLLGLCAADLRVPFDYTGDGLLHSLIVRSALDHGWFWINPDVGAPGGLELYDFPTSAHDAAHLLLLKAMALASKDWALVLNLYFLLGFPLITLSAMAVFRHFRVGYAAAAVGGILYAFLPSRLIKGESHLFLDTFFQVPLAVLVLLLVCGEDPPLFAPPRPRPPPGPQGRWPRFECKRRRSWGSLLACALIACTSLYYAFFTACLLVAGGAWASIERRSARNAAAGAALAGVIAVGLLGLGLPSIAYHLEHGPNHLVGTRAQWEAEYYGMKIAQLLLPVDQHRVPALRQLKDHYTGGAPFVGENGTTSLGVVGGVGFLLLLGAALVRRAGGRDEEAAPLRRLAALNLMAVLLGTIGGFGSIFAVLLSAQIRTYSRINVFIGFFALFVVVLLLDRLRRLHPRAALGVLPAVLIVGLLDQATPAAVRPYAATRRQYASDGDFVQRIEAVLPPGSAVFELPHVSFPDGPSYDPIRPYLHSRTLRWSEPTMLGRPGSAWADEVARLAPDRMIEALVRAGFSGVVIDRDASPGGRCGEENAFGLALEAKPIGSADGRYVFFNLTECEGGGCACGGVGQACCAGDRCRAGLLCQGDACTCGDLRSGGHLDNGEPMASCDGRFSLVTLSDGDVVVRGCGCPGEGETCWRSGTTGNAAASLTMQTDGNLVLFGKGCSGPHESCWSTNTVGHPAAHLTLQGDGDLCVVGGGCLGPTEACWCSSASARAHGAGR